MPVAKHVGPRSLSRFYRNEGPRGYCGQCSGPYGRYMADVSHSLPMDSHSLLMGRSGCFAADNAFKELSKEDIAEATVVLIGCG